MKMSDPLLKRFWFKTEKGFGIGVTAYSREDAEELIDEIDIPINKVVVAILEDVDIRALDQGHVIPNMGPPSFRGVWYPNANKSK
jgi:hypothetical protein